MSSETQREPSLLDGRGITVAALAVLLLITMATALVRLLATRQHNGTVAVTSSALQAPALSSTVETLQLAHYQASQSAWLHGYGWTDGTHGYAHIPIERAMQLLVAHPELAQPASPPPAEPSNGAPRPVDVPRAPDRPAPLVQPR
jgi:hypothetical protein